MNAPAPAQDRGGAGQGTPRSASPAPAQSENADGDETAKSLADNQREPGQMSEEEARELLDSAKSDEHHSLAVPAGPRDPNDAPDKAFKNW